MKPNLSRSLPAILLVATSAWSAAVQGDADNDGLRDEVETATGTYVSTSDTGTRPDNADTDADGVPDGLEVNAGTNPTDPLSRKKRPNIIYILADDLGYGDVGCFWQNQRPSNSSTWKFATPGLDAMATGGAMLTHHYVGAPICASSRASFLLGQNQGTCGVRDSQFDFQLPNNHNVASVLKSSGYKTIHIGKAGLAGTIPNEMATSEAIPAHPLYRGFDRFFGYLSHTHAHEHYPRNGTTDKHAKIYNDFLPITDAYVDVYTSDVFTAFAKKTIVEETASHPERPFFLYLAYDTPHFTGQNPPTQLYPTGNGLNGGLQWTGSPSYVNTATNDPAKVANAANRHPSTGANWYDRAQQFVSMVRRMDDSVTDLLQTLKDLGIDDNTLVVFTSDNGPADTELYPPTFQSYAGFEGIKGDLLEGGIRVPTIVWWPGKIPASNQAANIRKVATPCANWDWMPTFAELAGATAPSYTDGTSLMPLLTGQGTRKDKGYLYFEFQMGSFTSRYPDFPNHAGEQRNQMQAIRIGDYMGIRTSIATADDPFKIYDVVNDPKQGINLAASNVALQNRMKYLALAAHRKGGNVTRPYDGVPVPPVVPPTLKPGIDWKEYKGSWSWLPDFRILEATASGTTGAISSSVRTAAADGGLAFQGYISVPVTGQYTFQLASDAGSCLWIDETRLIDNDFNFAPVKTSDPVQLAAGLHPVRVHYRHMDGAPALSLKYTGPGIALQAIPSSSLFSDGEPVVFNVAPDTVVSKRNAEVIIDPLLNDSANYPISLSGVNGARSGIASVSAGKVVYQPNANFLGSDTFYYTETAAAQSSGSSITANILFDDETWIPLDEGTGTSVRAVALSRSTTGTLDGAGNGETSWVSGKYEKAVMFDGIDDQINLPDLVVPEGSAPRTFSCWIQTPATPAGEEQTLFSYGTAADGQRFAVKLNNIPGVAGGNALQLEVGGGGITGTRTLNDGAWHHVAVVLADRNGDGSLNADETYLYVDGMQDNASSSTPVAINTVPGMIPALGGSNHASNCNFAGAIDDVRIFPSALAGPEIALLRSTRVNYIYAADNSDSDGDGQTYDQEIRAGTDPFDAGSVFKISSMETAASSITLRWSAVAGKTYSVEESSDMTLWAPVPGVSPVSAAANNPDASISVPKGTSAKRFLRLAVN